MVKHIAIPKGFLKMPRIGIHFREKLTKNFEETLNRGGFEKAEEKRSWTFFGYPEKEIFGQILDEKTNPFGVGYDTAVTPGTTNIRGVTTLSRTLKTFALFLDTHAHAKGVSADGLINLYPGTDEEEPLKNAEVKELKYGSNIVPKFEDEAYLHRLGHTVENLYLMARPTPALKDRKLRGWGTIAECTIIEGVVSPYFNGMNIYSTGIVEDVMMRYFHQTMGETAENMMTEYSLYRRGWHTLASTDVGMSVQHMGYCIKLAIDARCGIYCVVEEGEYLGSIFYSFDNNFRFTIKGRVLKAIAGEPFQQALSQFGGHRVALKAVCEYLSGLDMLDADDDGEKTKVISPGSIRFARQLYRQVQRRRITQDDKEKLKPLIERLQFGHGYLPTTPENLAWMVEVAASEADYDIDTPMWIQGGALYTADPYRYAVSAFGNSAPSFLMTNGVQVKIPRIEMVEDPTEAINPKTNGKVMGFIAVVNKPLQIAATDLALVFEQKKIKVKYAMRGIGPAKASYTCNGPSKKVVWDALRKNVHPATTRASTMKRKDMEDRDEDEQEEIRKKAKLDKDSAMDIF